MTLRMWNDDSSPFRSRDLSIRRQLEQFRETRVLSSAPRLLTPRQKARGIRNKEMRELRRQGWLIKQIAYRFGISRTVVSMIVRGVHPA